MVQLKEFEDIARKNGFVDAGETEDESVMWLRKPSADAEERMCLDSQTRSVTVFWATVPGETFSKTFRVASMLQDWLISGASKERGDVPPTKAARG
jgi:hypothetical protein